MLYRLKKDYILRGWEKMPWVLVQRPDNEIHKLKQDEFQTLLLCDGETELDNNLMDDKLFGVLHQCEEKGYIEAIEKPASLENEQYYNYYNNRYVKSVFWSVTGKCNYRCRHCYVDGPDGRLGELSTVQALDLIDQMAACGVLRVDITGGEPFVRKDLWQLIDRILAHKMIVGYIYTNGWLIDEAVIAQFEKRGIKPKVQVSFDGIGWHDWMRGVSGAEQAALNALKMFHDHGFYTHVSMCVHRGNQHTIPKTVEMLKTVGVESIKISNVDMTDLWKCNNQGNAMTRHEYTEAMIPYIDWYYRSGRPIDELNLGGVALLQKDKPGELSVRYFSGCEDCLDHYMCGVTRWTCYITPEGRLLPCMPMTASPQQDKFPLVQDIGLKEGLSGSVYMQFVNRRIRDLFAANAECNECAYKYKCGGGCRASALAGPDHSLMGCDREMCEFWYSGYEARIRKAIEEAEAKYGGPMEK